MSNGLIAAIISVVSLLIAFLLGKGSEKQKSEVEKEVAQLQSKTRAQQIETASARKATEVVSDLHEAEKERQLTNIEIMERLTSASSDEEVFRLAGIMADRAAERIKRNARK